VAVQIISVHATGGADGQEAACGLLFELLNVDLRGQLSPFERLCPDRIEPDRADEIPKKGGRIAAVMLIRTIFL
jgi:hypothetical protein